VRRALLGAFLALAAAGALTYWAGEQTEVVVLRTRDGAGGVHETKMWAVDVAGEPWVRVANPERAWYRRLLANPNVELVRGGRAEPYLAEPQDTRAAAAALDAAFREKYGAVDWWYGVLLRRHAVPVRLRPSPHAAR
jgi:hypothetical protein